MTLFNESVDRLENGISKTVEAQKVIAKNIANLSNPNYIPEGFDDELKKAKIKLDRKVLLEQEMTKMSKNGLKYNAYLRLLTMKSQNLRRVATLGK
jgi:flagellar basal body rod protein FlgB